MPKYVVERELPGAGKLSDTELKALARKSCAVLESTAGKVQWQHSYVTDDKIYCVYLAPNEKAVQLHAHEGAFPLNRISRARRIIDPTTAE